MSAPATQKSIGVFMLAMISVSAIVGLRNLPIAATYGLSSVFFYVVSALFFFLPVALISAEIAAAWPRNGGVYDWIKVAFGDKTGTLAVWFEWVENICWLPTALSFMGGMIAYILMPSYGHELNSLAQDKIFLATVMLTILWGITFMNFLGVKTSGMLSTIGVIAGTIIPGALIIALGAIWVLQGHPVEIDISWSALIPSFNVEEYIHLAGIFLGFAGIEIAAYYIRHTKEPQSTFPKATLLAIAIILTVYILGTLSIAIVVPKDEITYHAGLMQGFTHFFQAFGLDWFVPIMAFLTVIGAMALLNTWLLGPAQGIWESAKAGNLPEFFTRANRHDSPTAILMTQALLGTGLIVVTLFNLDSIQSFYWIMTVLATQLILMMYILVFAAGIRLRFTHPDTLRPFKVPGGTVGMVILGSLGIVSALFCIVMGLIPPAELQMDNQLLYSVSLLIGLVCFMAPPFLFKRRAV